MFLVYPLFSFLFHRRLHQPPCAACDPDAERPAAAHRFRRAQQAARQGGLHVAEPTGRAADHAPQRSRPPGMALKKLLCLIVSNKNSKTSVEQIQKLKIVAESAGRAADHAPQRSRAPGMALAIYIYMYICIYIYIYIYIYISG